MKVEDMGKFSFLGSEEEVHGRIFRAFRFEKRDGVLYVRMPFFFPDSPKPLVLKIGMDGDGWFVADDMGAAACALSARVGDITPYSDVLDSFCYIFGEYRHMEDDHALRMSFKDARGFLRFIQWVSLAANADLYPAPMPDYDGFEMSSVPERWEVPKHLTGADDFIDLVADMIKVASDSDFGTLVGVKFYFDGECWPMTVRYMNGAENVTVTDFGGYDGGDLTDRMVVHCDGDFHRYDRLIEAVCRRYGCDFSHDKLTFTFTDNAPDTLACAAMHFLQAASVLGEIDHYVYCKI